MGVNVRVEIGSDCTAIICSTIGNLILVGYNFRCNRTHGWCCAWCRHLSFQLTICFRIFTAINILSSYVCIHKANILVWVRGNIFNAIIIFHFFVVYKFQSHTLRKKLANEEKVSEHEKKSKKKSEYVCDYVIIMVCTQFMKKDCLNCQRRWFIKFFQTSTWVNFPKNLSAAPLISPHIIFV